jgi:hypothetical protein
MHKQDVKQKVVHELIEYAINFVYIAFFLAAFMWYRRLVLAEYRIVYTNYWVPLIEAAVLAKIIMLGDLLGLGQKLEAQPLIIRTLYRTVVFILWIAAFRVVEATLRELVHHRGVTGGLHDVASRGWREWLAWGIVAVVAFIPFFAFRELGRVLGEDKLRALFLKRRTPRAPAL